MGVKYCVVDVNGNPTYKTVYAANFLNTDIPGIEEIYLDGYHFSGWKIDGVMYDNYQNATAKLKELYDAKTESTITVEVPNDDFLTLVILPAFLCWSNTF